MSAPRVAWPGRAATRRASAWRSTRRRRRRPSRSAAPPGIAAPSAPFDLQTVRIASCGLRDAGAPFGDVALEVRVYRRRQWLTEVRHPAWRAHGLAGAGRSRGRRPPPPAGSRRTARRVDAAAWQRSLARPAAAVPRRAWRSSTTNGRACSTTHGVAARGRGLAAGRPGRRRPGAGGAPRRRRSRCAPKARSTCSPARSSCACRASWSTARRASRDPGSLQGPQRAAHDARAARRQGAGRPGPEVGAAHLALPVHARGRAARRRRAVDAAAPPPAPMPITGALVGECGLRAARRRRRPAVVLRPARRAGDDRHRDLRSGARRRARSTRKHLPGAVAGRLERG